VIILTSECLQTLAKVICTVLRFTAEQTQKVMEKESKKAVCDFVILHVSIKRTL